MTNVEPLREWVAENGGKAHRIDCYAHPLGRDRCTCGLEAALKAAGVIEDEPDVEKAWDYITSDNRSKFDFGYDDTRRIIERARGWADAMEFLANLLHDLEAARGHVGGGWGSQLQKREVELRQFIERAREAK